VSDARGATGPQAGHPPGSGNAGSGNGGASATVRVLVNGEARSLPDGCTLAEVVAGLSSAASGVAAALNEAVVPRGQWPTTRVGDGDRVEVLTAVQGG
jgi:sulfur carrier protein